ncbi:ChbG/HpnK family deacetylase [Acinetobacter sp. MB5]|uniref:ChbG/HpnK family deacetylase n=1 Tax=Acinetobacter sp. MB5 TaxID=2069438 RepID=UPI000DCF6F18|nr:ChbG/HpnK family deacetylase [Acinetobacter sp. MB5]
MIRVCYCADDFALHPSISSAIIDLIAQQRLHATSCMTQSPDWSHAAQQLKPYAAQADLGLHLNFTHVFSADTYAFPLNTLMVKAWSRQLSSEKIYDSLAEQWQTFTNALGKVPDFVDGHQHVHQFPVIREVLIQFLKEQNFKGWIRNLSHTLVVSPYQFKTHMLMQLGSKSLKQLCLKNNFKQNEVFAGIYDFQQIDYAALNQKWLHQAQDNLLIMCHPAQYVIKDNDPIKTARLQEYQYLASEQFIHDCQANQITLTRIGVSA